ncbi:MAG: hypothetical protein PHW03_02855 [Eubacteriales bacterium]|nr:hypothetical protein [Eubacteriales bacterium]
MKKVSRYKCEGCSFTGNKKQVTEHEKTCPDVENVRKKNEQEILVKEMQSNIRLKAKSISHLEQLLNEYSKATGENLTVSLSIQFKENVRWSHSHHAPIGKKTNWGSSDPTQPTSYPGYEGRVEFIKPDKTGEYAGHMFTGWTRGGKVEGFHTGSGGGGYEAKYDCYLFIDDFPLIKEKVDKAREIAKQADIFDENERIKSAQLSDLTKEKLKIDPVTQSYANEIQKVHEAQKCLSQRANQLEGLIIQRRQDVKLFTLDENPSLKAEMNQFRAHSNSFWSKALHDL